MRTTFSPTGRVAVVVADQPHLVDAVDTLRIAPVVYGRSSTIQRDGSGRISGVTFEGVDVWTIARDGEGRIASITNGTITKTITRDGEGRISGVNVTGY